MSSLATQLLLHTLQITFSAYALLVVTHFLLQTSFAHRSHRRFVRGTGMTTSDGYLPSVDVVVAAYDEDPDSLAACFESLVEQDYPGTMDVYVVDDCSPNRAELAPIYERFGALPGWRVLLPDWNRGKRHAQDTAFRDCRGEIMVTIGVVPNRPLLLRAACRLQTLCPRPRLE